MEQWNNVEQVIFGSMMHISDQKKQLRQSIGERLKHMSEKDGAAESRSICCCLLPLITVKSKVCAYYPLKTEADLRPLMEELLRRGDNLYLPRFEGKSFVFRRVEDLNNLKPGTYSIPEPPMKADLADPSSIDIVLVPGRAFDRKGNRLGRGNAGYDRWINTQRKLNPDTKIWGVALECQIVQELPTEEHDERLDAIVTAHGMLNANQ